ncbi:hypothetical protein ABPG73_004784 [Tetrahymena malaccensis]
MMVKLEDNQHTLHQNIIVKMEDQQLLYNREFRSESIESQNSSCSLSSPFLISSSLQQNSLDQIANQQSSELPKLFEELSQEQMIQHILISSYSPQHKDLCQYLATLIPFFKNEWKGFNDDDDNYLVYCFNYYKEANNTVKNLVRSFITYMKKKCDSLIIECMDSENKDITSIQKNFKKFVGKQSINNNFLQKIIQSERYGIQFQYYLKVYSFHWLAKSKITNKYAHLIAIFFILRCFSNQSLIEEITAYKKD